MLAVEPSLESNLEISVKMNQTFRPSIFISSMGGSALTYAESCSSNNKHSISGPGQTLRNNLKVLKSIKENDGINLDTIMGAGAAAQWECTCPVCVRP